MQSNHFPAHMNPGLLQGGQGNPGFNQSQGFDPRVFQQGTPNPAQGFMPQQNGTPRPRQPSGGGGMNPMLLQQQQQLMAQQSRQGAIDGLNPALMGMGGGGGGGMGGMGNMDMMGMGGGGMNMGGGMGGNMRGPNMGMNMAAIPNNILGQLTEEQLQAALMAKRSAQAQANQQHFNSPTPNPQQQNQGFPANPGMPRRDSGPHQQSGLQGVLAHQQATQAAGAFFDSNRPSSTTSAGSAPGMGMQMNNMNAMNNMNMGMNNMGGNMGGMGGMPNMSMGMGNMIGMGMDSSMMPPPPPPRPSSTRPGTALLPPPSPAMGNMLPPSRPTTAAGMGAGSPTAPFAPPPQVAMGSPRRRTNSGGLGMGPDTMMGMNSMGAMGGVGGIGPVGGMGPMSGVGMLGGAGPGSVGGMPGNMGPMAASRGPDPMMAAAAAVTSPIAPKREQSESLPPPSRAGKPPSLPASVPPKPAKTEATVHGSTLDRATTRVSYVKPDELSAMSEDEVAQVKGWMEADKADYGRWTEMKGRMRDEAETAKRSLVGWWEEPDYQGRRQEKWNIIYPGQAREKREKERERAARGKKGAAQGRKGWAAPTRVRKEDVDKPELLVPIRLELDVEHHKLRDTFVWNLNDGVVTPEALAQTIVDDYQLAPSYVATISKQVADQLADFQAHQADEGDADDESGPVQGRLNPGAEDAKWWDMWRARKRRRLSGGTAVSALPAANDDDAPEELRILVKLEITVGSIKLDDQFEWDITNAGASPEQFAEVYAADLGLGGEFKTAIAHSIREQVQTFQKSLFLVGHPSDGSAVQDEDLRMAFLPSLASAARPLDQVSSFTPLLNYLSDSELERNDKERERDAARRKKRNTRGRRGVALPDREPIKTARTPAIGFPEIDPAVLAANQAAAAPAGRRAAAAAASLTIANMVANENRGEDGPGVVATRAPSNANQAHAQAQAAQAAKEKEKAAKGHFKPPPYEPTAIHPRARVQMPTRTTAADAASLPPPLADDPPMPMAATPPAVRGHAGYFSARRAKEMEREAKEREFADGQHPNMIDGVWHCSNCGCPEDIAVGRRKGPLGDKSQCGTCGKFWHRHRRPRPVTYNADAAFHRKVKEDADKAKNAGRRRRGNVVRDGETPGTPNKRGRANSVASTSSSASEAPLSVAAARGRRRGATANVGEEVGTPATGGGEQEEDEGEKKPSIEPPATGATEDADEPMDDVERPPQWLVQATEDMRKEYPDDRFEIVDRPGRNGEKEWRMKCVDCPGKVSDIDLYKPNKEGELGLSNFEVHLKNRQHRKIVNDRLATAADAGSGAGTTANGSAVPATSSSP